MAHTIGSSMVLALYKKLPHNAGFNRPANSDKDEHFLLSICHFDHVNVKIVPKLVIGTYAWVRQVHRDKSSQVQSLSSLLIMSPNVATPFCPTNINFGLNSATLKSPIESLTQQQICNAQQPLGKLAGPSNSWRTEKCTATPTSQFRLYNFLYRTWWCWQVENVIVTQIIKWCYGHYKVVLEICNDYQSCVKDDT